MNRKILFIVLMSVFFTKLLFSVPRGYSELQKINDLVAKEEIDLLKKNINYLKTLKNDILAKNINKTVFGLLLKKVEFAIGKKKSRKAKKFKKKKRKKPVVPKFDIKKARLAIKKIKKTAPWDLTVKDLKMAKRALKKFPRVLGKKDDDLKDFLSRSAKKIFEEIRQYMEYLIKIEDVMMEEYVTIENAEFLKKLINDHEKKLIVPELNVKKQKLAIKKVKESMLWELTEKDWKMAQRTLKKFPGVLDNKKDESLKILLGKPLKEILEGILLGKSEKNVEYEKKIKKLMEKKASIIKNYEKVQKKLVSLKKR